MGDESDNSMNEKGYTENLKCSKETKKLIMEDCVKMFLEDNPDFQGMKISQNFILKRIAKVYLKWI